MVCLNFAKYEGLGNDFIMIDREVLSPEVCRALCDRHFGVGADGVISVMQSPVSDCIASMHITNADGSAPEMCGNGLRCAAQWLFDQGKIQPGQHVSIMTPAGAKSVQFDDGQWLVDMGETTGFAAIADADGFAISIGNPHLVLSQYPTRDEMMRLGAQLEHHTHFPERTNVEFVRQTGPQSMDVAVWERGVGLTLACGTGACAAVAVAVLRKQMPSHTWITVNLPGGQLRIRHDISSGHVWMKGPARRAFVGEVEV